MCMFLEGILVVLDGGDERVNSVICLCVRFGVKLVKGSGNRELKFFNFEHIELRAKLLDYFLRSNNQKRVLSSSMCVVSRAGRRPSNFVAKV